MNNLTFSHKYKPRKIEDFSLDADLTDMLQTFIQIDSINILLIGNSGSGKTSLTNAIINNYYQIGENQSIPRSNILIVNDLREQGIQYFRGEMKTFCQSKSTIYGKKKLLIIDDLDNVSDHCQQVFRNYIDKYSSNINFIATCQNCQKVIESIQSRVHMLKLNPVSAEHTLSIMKTIIDNENISIDDDSLQYLIKVTNGSIRQIYNYLEKFHILGKPIHLSLCKSLCTNINTHELECYMNNVKQNNRFDANKYMMSLYEHGYSVIDILDHFFFFVKQTNILSENEKYHIIPILCRYITYFHDIHEHPIELALFTNDMCKHFTEKSF